MSISAIVRHTLTVIGAVAVAVFAVVFAWAFTRERKRLKAALTPDEERAFAAIARELRES